MKSFRNNLATCALVLSSAGVANAKQLIVFEAPVDGWRKEVSADFAVNRELGRAWIDVQLESTDPGEESPSQQVISKTVEGVYYDPARKQVLYRTATESIVCAEDATFLWRTYLKPTGRCQLTPLYERRNVDDGFRIRGQTLAKVAFEAKQSNDGRNDAQTQATLDTTALIEQLKGAEISLEQGMGATTAEGKPISAKFEVENGKLQLSVYVARRAGYVEVIVDHKTGKIAKAEQITGAADLAAALAQGEAMARAKTSLQGALAKAATTNDGYRAISVTSALKDSRPIAYITLMKGEDSKTISEALD
jgi:hypothetical protein